MDDNLKDKFRKGCYPTEADYQALIEAVMKIRDDVSIIKERLSISDGTDGGTEDGGGTDVPDTPQIPDVPENPKMINEYLEGYDWLKGDGTNSIAAYRPIPGSNTYKSADVTLRAVLKVDELSTKGDINGVSGASLMTGDVRYRNLSIALKKLEDGRFAVGYFGCQPITNEKEFFGSYSLGSVLEIEGTEKSVTINGVTYDKTAEERGQNLSTVAVLHSATVLGDKAYIGQIARFEYIAGGTVFSSLIPAKATQDLPADMAYDGKEKAVGTVGMWDTVNEKFLTSSSANSWSVMDEE